MTDKSDNIHIHPVKQPDRIISYFKLEIIPLLLITVSGIIYNIGMTAGPLFEGKLAQCLYDIIDGTAEFRDMLILAVTYIAVILIVQTMRYIKRFYVRRFANDTSRNMRHMLYNSLIHKSRNQLEQESIGNLMTKAISDVDACAEGMRKFTTEIFDTGVVLIAYLVMLFYLDVKLSLIACVFTPIAYIIASALKKKITYYNSVYKKSSGILNSITLDRVSNAITYRVYGCEKERADNYEEHLLNYEHAAVHANMWENFMQPIYNVISMSGVIFIIFLGARNINGTGWTIWNIGMFTTYMSCFAKMALKSSKAAKLFNAVQKAKVSWSRIKPLMNEYIEDETFINSENENSADILTFNNVSFSYTNNNADNTINSDNSNINSHLIINNLSFNTSSGTIIGVTGPVASGKSTFGKLFLCESPYIGSITINNEELSDMSSAKRSSYISYMGHQPELISGSLQDNICLGDSSDCKPYIHMACLDDEVNSMPEGINTYIGNGGVRLSGGQQARVALARTLYNSKKIIILDDPFSAVDKNTEHIIMDNIKRISSDKIIFIMSHRLDIFPDMNKIIFINEGIFTVSTHDELIKNNELYKKLYNAQTCGGDLDEN